MSMSRSAGQREPLYHMTEICEKLGITAPWVNAMSKRYGAIKPEFGRSSGVCGKAYFRTSVVRAWLKSIQPESLPSHLRRASSQQHQTEIQK